MGGQPGFRPEVPGARRRREERGAGDRLDHAAVGCPPGMEEITDGDFGPGFGLVLRLAAELGEPILRRVVQVGHEPVGEVRLGPGRVPVALDLREKGERQGITAVQVVAVRDHRHEGFASIAGHQPHGRHSSAALGCRVSASGSGSPAVRKCAAVRPAVRHSSSW